ncbi:MAG: thermonuclease family protein [Cyanobacteria bacterium]|nr:thermonuclease family protein [Cyanobacteria bacterium CG_2015-16_32_12]NCO79081.1 thermonuclease family protein [Cyanobacteria bacterium CG_2015-22_32_23]NCQ04711.1 thermonuclease family protein [Cyanobacteria bacterium CG_2015-09_32_10]NCQ42602.1 thermonuclease family protein [Cyanobacteria bacterium CG_2015-04_32_10]NCS85821.1 thermonuclease family protein [Cyanobacteria bacterium CG_2015-02_32_10]
MNYPLINKFLVILISLCLLIVGCQNNPKITRVEANIRRVISAQTIEVIINNQTYQFRLMGLNTPNRQQQPWGKEAKEVLVNLLTLEGKNSLNSTTVILETNLETKDKFNRLNGYIWYNNQLINQKLLEQGYGLVNLTYTDGKYDQQLLQAQSYARIMEKGIWNPQKPLREINY